MNTLPCVSTLSRASVMAALCLAVAIPIHANELLGVRWNEGPHNTRVVLDLEQEAEFTFGTLEGPPRIYIDLQNTSLQRRLDIGDIDSRVLKRVRHADSGQGKYRVVLDLKNQVDPTVFKLEPYGPYGHRLVIDLPSEFVLDDCSTDTEPHEDVVVVLDAGHGGEDPGAIGITKMFEKHVNLAIARHTKTALESAPGFKVIMTRDGDYEVPLVTRRNIALGQRAHLFVSIHADSFKRPGPRGVSVYVLDSGKAQTELDRWSVENENRADWRGGVASWVNSDCFEEPDQYKFLNERARDVVLDSSVSVGKSVLAELSSVAHVHPKGLTRDRGDFRVTDAGFVVLKSTQVPSILVETGFLSNPQDARLLGQASHQLAVGQAIAKGILAYFCDNPPWHTKLSRGDVECTYSRDFKTYRVQRGDTLGEIALANNVSVTSIRQANKLPSDRIYINQLLTIPIRMRQN
ncbi:MAG: N-acetylmuramoyl-L-alanine amidase [Gammaproteobacteria bacterium]|nr:N-acetylmuramoyl-L-alanine amidase [Gammaproteobacteria bacterium]